MICSAGCVACEGWLGRAVAVSLAEHNHSDYCSAPEYQHTRTQEHHQSYCKALPYRKPLLLQCTRTREHKQLYCSAPDLTFGAPRFGGAPRFCQQTCTRLLHQNQQPGILWCTKILALELCQNCAKATQLKGAWSNFAKITREALKKHKDRVCLFVTKHLSLSGSLMMIPPGKPPPPDKFCYTSVYAHTWCALAWCNSSQICMERAFHMQITSCTSFHLMTYAAWDIWHT